MKSTLNGDDQGVEYLSGGVNIPHLRDLGQVVGFQTILQELLLDANDCLQLRGIESWRRCITQAPHTHGPESFEIRSTLDALA